MGCFWCLHWQLTHCHPRPRLHPINPSSPTFNSMICSREYSYFHSTIYVHPDNLVLYTRCSITNWNYICFNFCEIILYWAVHFLYGRGGSIISKISFQLSLNLVFLISVVLTSYDFKSTLRFPFL